MEISLGPPRAAARKQRVRGLDLGRRKGACNQPLVKAAPERVSDAPRPSPRVAKDNP